MDLILQEGLYDLILVVLGILFLAAGWLPRELSSRPLSPPIVYMGMGILFFSLPLGLPSPDPLDHGVIAERVTELIVIIALVMAGLQIDRPLGRRSWGSTWRLLAVTMPLSIAAMAWLGWWAIGLGPASALLLGAVLAPTDPVLAEDVQVAGPGEGWEDEVRFGLTSEAGLNDGLAFPFTNLAIAAALVGIAPGNWLADWLRIDVGYRVGVGVAVGALAGYAMSRFLFHLPFEHRLAKRQTGFVVLAITFLVYGTTELLGGYGFLAVFVAPLTMRHLERSRPYHAELHAYAEQSERLLRVTVLFLLGGAIAGGLLSPLTWSAALAGLAFLFLVRPLFGYLALVGSGVRMRERAAISFFGIRGIGSLYYLAYGLNHGDFADPELLWATVGFVVIVSIVVHGIAGSPVMAHFDRGSEG